MEIVLERPFEAKNGSVQPAWLRIETPLAGGKLDIREPDGIRIRDGYDMGAKAHYVAIEVKPEAVFELEGVLNRIFELEEGLEAEALRYRDVLISIVEHWAKEMDVNVISEA